MKTHFKLVSAKKYYGKQADGSVLLRNGEFLMHGEPVAGLKRKLKREHLLKELGMKETDFSTVWIVVTIVNDGERDLFADVVLITKDIEKAKKLTAKLKKHKVKLDWLSEYDDAAFFSRTIDRELK